jgi:hypothetical protein
MTRDQAIDIARRRALNSRDTHAYLPVTQADAATWMPHEWVIDAILWAAGFPVSLPTGAAQRINDAQSAAEVSMNDAQTLAEFVLALRPNAKLEPTRRPR